jgi:hypothetical protein
MKQITIGLLLATLLFSCKKEEQQLQPEEPLLNCVCYFSSSIYNPVLNTYTNKNDTFNYQTKTEQDCYNLNSRSYSGPETTTRICQIK